MGWRLVLVTLLLLAGALRADGLRRGWTADELGNLAPFGAWASWTDPETAVNPPLLRTVVGLLVPESQAPSLGRVLSWVAGTASAALAAVVARRAGGSTIGGAVAGLLVAVHPIAVVDGAEFRAYALVGASIPLYVLALDEALARGGRLRWGAAAGLAVLAVHLHYLAAPVLLGIGLACAVTTGSRRGVWAAAPAALSLVTVLPLMGQVEHRVAPLEPASVVLTKVMALGLTPPLAAADAGLWLWTLGTSRPFSWPAWMAGSLLALIGGLLCAAGGRAASSGCSSAAGWGSSPASRSLHRGRTCAIP